MTEMRDGGAVAFIGPDLNCTNEALVAAAWNLPMIAYVSRYLSSPGFPQLEPKHRDAPTSSQKCSEHALSDKRTYPTFARTIPPTQKIAESIVAVLKHYDWRRIVVVAGKHLPMFSNVKGRQMCSVFNGSNMEGHEIKWVMRRKISD